MKEDGSRWKRRGWRREEIVVIVEEKIEKREA